MWCITRNQPNRPITDMSNLCKRHYLLPALTVGFVLVLAEQLSAQTFKVLYTLTLHKI